MISPQQALTKLIEGNERFAKGDSFHPNRCEETKNALLKEQKPFVAVLSCSDSRVPIEIIFDAGLGDIFSVRTAGHVLSKEVIGSLEYAVRSLGVKLILIIGHENCGAIKKAVETHNNKSYGELSENLQSIMNHIYPAIEKLPNSDEECLDDIIRSNIHYQVEDLINKDEYISQKVQANEIMLFGAEYSLATGLVTLFQNNYNKTEAIKPAN
jgi:carbonic anhydrase